MKCKNCPDYESINEDSGYCGFTKQKVAAEDYCECNEADAEETDGDEI